MPTSVVMPALAGGTAASIARTPFRRIRRKTAASVAAVAVISQQQCSSRLQLPPEIPRLLVAMCPGSKLNIAAVSTDWCFEATRLKASAQRHSVANVAADLAQQTQPRLVGWQDAMDAAISSVGADVEAVRTAVRTCRRLVALGETEGGRHLGAHFRDAALNVVFLNTLSNRPNCRPEHRAPLLKEARALHKVITLLADAMRSAFPSSIYMTSAGERCRCAAARLAEQDQLRAVLEVLQEVLEIIGEMVKLVEHVIDEYWWKVRMADGSGKSFVANLEAAGDGGNGFHPFHPCLSVFVAAE